MFIIKRSPHNPILGPIKEHPWEAFSVFNWSPVKIGNTVHAVYRAVSLPQSLRGTDFTMSSIGYTKSTDSEHFEDRKQLITPEFEWEKFGCEDPRITLFEDKYYIFYTAISEYPFKPQGIRVAVAVTDDLSKIDEKHLVTPFNAKAMVLFPERVGGKITAILTANTDQPPSKIAVAQFEKQEDIWSEDFWRNWYANLDEHVIEPRRLPTDHVEVGAPPIKTKEGWLLLYSHIQNYHTNNKLFGIEALLLDLQDPQKIVGRTKGAMFVPEEIYEKYGHIGNIIFPSGCLVEGDKLQIYYGACDMTCCVATVDINALLSSIHPETAGRLVTRFDGNPIITPNPTHEWEAKATFNPAAVELGGKIHLLYRAMSQDNTSVIGYAASFDGFKIDERIDIPVYVPREAFEVKRIPGGNSGCEDPRLIKIGGILYMCYTAFDGINPPRVAATSISQEDFLAKRWNWSKPETITPEGIDDKDTCIFPEKINDKYMVLHRVESHVCADFLNSLDFTDNKVTKCIQMFGPRPGMWDSKKVGIASPPLKTGKGWLLFYHGVSDHNAYRVGATLLDLKDPTIVISRTSDPILEPVKEYEKVGEIPNVVFPCGVVNRNGTLFLYYGGADKVVCVATMKLDELLSLM